MNNCFSTKVSCTISKLLCTDTKFLCTYSKVVACIVLISVFSACNGGQRPGDPVKEHHFDSRDTVASLYPGEENLASETDSLENDSLTELFDQHVVGPDAPVVED